jgi:hypothetical protein
MTLFAESTLNSCELTISAIAGASISVATRDAVIVTRVDLSMRDIT